jgi:exosome complex component RRP4
MNKLVVPGDLLTDKVIRSPYVFVKEGKSYASVIGVYDAESVKFIPLKGAYLPQIGDGVIGVVEEEKVIGYDVNLFGPYRGLLFSRGLRSALSPGDIIVAEISEMSEVKDIILARPRKLNGGQLVFIPPTKVSRIIGKQMSMLQLLQQGTRCEISVGKNGVVWLKGAEVNKAIEAVLKIERESHIGGLTERIQKFLGIEGTGARAEQSAAGGPQPAGSNEIEVV